MSDEIVLPDEEIDKLFADTDDEGPELADDPDEPDDTDDDESDDADTDEDESGDEEPDEPDDEEEDEEEDEDESDTDEPDDDESDDEVLPKFDRKKIEKDPDLKAAYKHMQAAFTKKMQEAAELRGNASELIQEAEGVLTRHQEFLKVLASEEGAEDFLVNVAVNRPEVFQKAHDRAAELLEDPDKLKRFSREKEIEKREKALADKEAKEQVEAKERQKNVLRDTTETMAKKVGLKGEGDLKVAHRFVRARIQENLDLTGKASITREEIVEAVKEAAELLSRREKKGRKEVVKDVVAAKKQSAKKRRRPGAPRSSSRPAGKKGRLDVPKGVDPLDHAVDVLLGDS